MENQYYDNMKTSIAIDLGGTRIKIGIVKHGEILSTTIVDAFSDKGLVPRLSTVEESIDGLLEQLKITSQELGGIGISIPGIVDTQSMRLLSVNQKFSDAVDFSFTEWALKKWNLPLVIENDARCALVGEWQYGAGKGSDNVVMMTLGTGVGGSAIIEGKLLRGKHFQAGCLAGHFTINYHGITCNCGNVGCVESEASSWRLPQKANQHSLFASSSLSGCETIDYRNVFEFAEKGDNLSIELMNESLEAWSAGVINLIHAYDPEVVVIGGGIMKSQHIILPFIQEKVKQHAWTPWGNVKVAPAQFPDSAALLGADYLLRNNN